MTSLIEHLNLVLSSQTDPAIGDMIMRGPSGGWIVLPSGDEGNLLEMNGSVPTWRDFLDSTVADELVQKSKPNVLRPVNGTNLIVSNVDLPMAAGGALTQQQVLTMTGGPTSGSVKLGYKASTTNPLVYNATAAAVENELQALPDVSADGGISCVGGPWPGTAITVVWNNPLSPDGIAPPFIIPDISGLAAGKNLVVTAGRHVHLAGSPAFEVDQIGRVILGPSPQIDRTKAKDSHQIYADWMWDPQTLRTFQQMQFLRMRANPVNIGAWRTTGVYPYTPGRAYLASPVTNASASIPLDTNTRGNLDVASGAAGFQSEFGSSGFKYAGIEDGPNRGVAKYTSVVGNSLMGVTWVDESTPGQTYPSTAIVTDLSQGDTTLLDIYGGADVGNGGFQHRAAQISVKISQRQEFAFTDTGGTGQPYHGGRMLFVVSSVGSKGFPSLRTEWWNLDDRGYALHIGGGKPAVNQMTRKAEIGGPMARMRIFSRVKVPGGISFDSSGNIASLPLRSVAEWDPAGGGIKIDPGPGIPSVRCTYASLDIVNNLVLSITGGTPNQFINDQAGAYFSWTTLPNELLLSDVGPFDKYHSGNLWINGNFATYANVDTVNRKLTGVAWRQDRSATALASTDIVTLTAHGLTNGTAVIPLDLAGGAPLVAGTTYYTRDVTTNTFKLAATLGGAAIDITSDITSCLIRSTPTTPPQALTGDDFVYSGPNFTTPVLGVSGPIVANDSVQATPRTRTQMGAGIGPLGEGGLGVGSALDAGFWRKAQGQSSWIGSLDVPGSLTRGGLAVVLTNDSRLSVASDNNRRLLILSAQALLAETFLSNQVNAATATTAGVSHGVLLETGLAAGDVCTGIVVGVALAAQGTLPTMFKVGLADASGNLVAVSADQSSLITAVSVGKIKIPFTAPVTIGVSGAYYAVLLQVGSWTGGGAVQPTFGNRTSTVSAIAGGAVPGSIRPSVMQTAQTDLSGSISLATGDGVTYWMGIY